MRIRSWLQLLRAPNLFTVPGDSLAGFLLATFGVLTGRAAFVIVASLCLYGAGLILNDLCDLEEDRRERPDRPLPSGAVSVGGARFAVIALALTGIGTLIVAASWRGLLIGIGLLLAIVSYNCFTKRLPFIGALNMGFCRGLSVYAGGVAAYDTVFPRSNGLFIVAGLSALYITAVTNLARHETRASIPLLARLLPTVAAVFGLIVMTWGTGPLFSSPATGCYACGFLLVVKETVALFRQPPSPLPPRIGALIRIALVFQAAFCVAVPISQAGWICTITLLLFFPLSGAVSRRFYAS